MPNTWVSIFLRTYHCVHITASVGGCPATAVPPRQGKGFGPRQPLKDVLVATLPSKHPPDEKLSRPCAEMGETVRNGGRRGRVGEEDSGEAISELLDDMMLQQSAERRMERQKNK